jgi:hypothetical protein
MSIPSTRTAPALTIGELAELLTGFDQSQKIVFSDMDFGDFDVTGFTGAKLSEDNFTLDRRPIFRLRKRRG